MPKLLFYLGVSCTLLLALASAVAARGLPVSGIASLGLPISSLADAATSSAGRTMLIFLVTIPVAALFLRMASLLAVRNLFAACLAIFAVSCTALAVLAISLLRMPIHGVVAPPELHHAGFIALGALLSVTLLVFRPYFKVQASRLLPALVSFPMPLFIWGALENLSRGGSVTLRADSAPLLLFLMVLASIFLAVALHSFRHRHLFIEVTNLRELLDSPMDPGAAGQSGHAVGFGGDIAFHH
ncbi:MAG TPA: hypothetical protein VNM92_05035 [Thermoanaerobaculia bacterium]|nr:hypothetical protein [Thermoanaerobaculia bacterium]